MRYTKYLDQSLRELEDAAEYETDQLAVQLVRIQHLADKISYFHCGDQLVDEPQGIPKGSTAVCLEAFQMQLDKLRNALTLDLKSDCEMNLSPEQANRWCASLTRYA